MTKAKNEPFKVGPLRVYPQTRDSELTGKWMIDVPPHLAPGGKRQRPTFATKTEAEREAKRLLRELQLDGAISGTGPKLSGVTFTEFARRWLDIQKELVELKQKRPISLKADAERMRHLLSHFAQRDILKISSDDMRAYQLAAVKARSPSSVNGEVRLMKTILLEAARRELIQRVPKMDFLPEPRQHVELPTMQEMVKILGHLPPHIARIVRFIAETGCRRGEAFNLEWTDLHPGKPRVTIRDKEHWQAKNKTSNRTIPISIPLMDALLAAKVDGEEKAVEDGTTMPTYVFPGRGGVRMADFRKALSNAVKAAGIVRDGKPLHVNPKNLRKSFITWQAERGFAESLIQASVGHKLGSPVTRENYTHHGAEALRVAVLDLGQEGIPAVRRRIRGIQPEETPSTPGNVAKAPNLRAPNLATSGNKRKMKKA